MANPRYIRQTLLKEIGPLGQEKLAQARLVIIGCGGLGSIAAPYLAGAGIGRIVLVDGDLPQVSNLHRQVMLAHDGLSNKSKAEVLKEKLNTLNPEVEIVAISEMLSKQNIATILKDSDLVLECTDAILIKYLVNDYCALHKIPMVYGAIHKFEGYLSFFRNKVLEDIHLRDIFPEPNEDIPSCSEVGVLGTIAGLIGLLQANEAIKYFAGVGKLLEGRLLTYNILNYEQLVVGLKKNYPEDLSDVYAANDYQADSICDVVEIDYDDFKVNRAAYKLVSILESHEHENIDAEVVHMPLSNNSLLDYKQAITSKTVFYCKTGFRSGNLVSQLQRENETLDIYSLKAGVAGVNASKI